MSTFISGCKGMDPDMCIKNPSCSYVRGRKRQYCRLKNNRTKKATKPNAETKKKNKKSEVDVIQQFMRNTTFKRKAEFLKANCVDSGACYAFGLMKKRIVSFFNGFTAFEFVKPPIVAIGNPSANGFVKSLQYERNGYTANAVLKSSTKANADNLAYEFVVGSFLNKMSKQFPCFVETHGLFYYKDEALWEHARDTKVIQSNVLRDSLKLYKTSTSYKNEVADIINDGVCEGSKYSAILIQNLRNVRTISDVFRKESDKRIHNFILFELMYVLYQVYMPLAMMVNNFTHYDLHHSNVMLYEPVEDKYIQYHYHIGDEVVSFKSKYMVKIIDYGRAFYKDPDNSKNTATAVLKEICTIPDCNEKPEVCGDKSGFKYLTNDAIPSTSYMSSSIKNPSSDLRLIHMLAKDHDVGSASAYFSTKLYDKFGHDTISDAFEPLMDLMENTNYGIGLGLDPDKDTIYGTRPLPHHGFPSRINNVEDAEKFIRTAIMTNQAMQDLNEYKYKNMDKLGDMHVFSDGRKLKFKVHRE